MKIWQKIIAFLTAPVAVFTLLFGINGVSREEQLDREVLLEEQAYADFEPVVRFAVCSDIHVHEPPDNHTAERFAELFRTAYEYSDSHPTYKTLDAVLVAGDVTDHGLEAEWDSVLKVVEENKRPETEFIPVMGNHDIKKSTRGSYSEKMGIEPDVHKVVKGFHIIGLSPFPTETLNSHAQFLWMEKQISDAERDDPDKPVFTMQHAHIFNTVYVSHSWFHPFSLSLHAVYSMHPQVINFSGHSHGPINNPRSIWQNSYTQLGTGTLNYFEMENDIGDDTRPENNGDAAQYYIIEVDAENHVRALPFNILTGEFFKTPSTTDDPDKQLIYYINDAFDKDSYAYTNARKKTDSVPFFPEGAKITVSDLQDGKTTVTFDCADADVCVYGYEIKMKDNTSAVSVAKKQEVYAEYYFEPAPTTQHCEFDKIKAGHEYTVTVTPMNVWKQKGEAITAVVRF